MPKQSHYANIIGPSKFVDPRSTYPEMARELKLIKGIAINVEGLPRIDIEDIKLRQACVSLIGKLFLSENN